MARPKSYYPKPPPWVYTRRQASRPVAVANVPGGDESEDVMDSYDKFYSELVAILNGANLVDTLGWMAVNAQSIILNYGEDNRQWECSWIIGGRRYWSVRESPLDGMRDILRQIRTKMLEDGRYKYMNPGFDDTGFDEGEIDDEPEYGYGLAGDYDDDDREDDYDDGL